MPAFTPLTSRLVRRSLCPRTLTRGLCLWVFTTDRQLAKWCRIRAGASQRRAPHRTVVDHRERVVPSTPIPVPPFQPRVSTRIPKNDCRSNLAYGRCKHARNTGENMRTFETARTTAFAFGKDNAYKGNPDGGDRVARTSDSRRRYGHAAHAVLGSGSFFSPTSVAIQPEAHLPFGAAVYIYGMGWFVVEDMMNPGLPGPRFDMWSGPSTSAEMNALDGTRKVLLYTDRGNVPSEIASLGPSPL